MGPSKVVLKGGIRKPSFLSDQSRTQFTTTYTPALLEPVYAPSGVQTFSGSTMSKLAVATTKLQLSSSSLSLSSSSAPVSSSTMVSRSSSNSSSEILSQPYTSKSALSPKAAPIKHSISATVKPKSSSTACCQEQETSLLLSSFSLFHLLFSDRFRSHTVIFPFLPLIVLSCLLLMTLSDNYGVGFELYS